jgi:hypothetical protein
MPWLHFFRPAQGELYSWRRNVARAFERFAPAQMEIFGPGWNGERISWCPLHKNQSYLNWMPDTVDYNLEKLGLGKRKRLGEYKFVIASENFRGSKGYISEKIFDAILGGSVPVYFGEKKIADFIPKNSFIDASEFHSLEHLVKKLERMSEEEWQQIRSAGKAFLNSNEFLEFTNKKFALKMCYHVKALD